MLLKLLTSPQNPLIKSILQLQEKARARRQSGQFAIEGRREIGLAVKGGYDITDLLFFPEKCTAEEAARLAPGATLYEIGREVFDRIAYREGSDGLLALARAKSLELDALQLSDNPLILVAEAPEKPGNIGALLRTADAARLDAVIIANPKGDLYNPNIIRSSVGCLFTTQVATGTTTDVIYFLKAKGVALYAAALQDASEYHHCDFTTPTALVVGTEDSGLTQEWRDAAVRNIQIPMQGEIDSMNVSVAAAVLIFEAKRQRNFQ